MIKKRRKFNIGDKISNTIIGVGLGALFGWYIAVILSRFLPFDVLIYSFFIITLSLAGFYFSLRRPILTEKVAFGVTILIFSQVFWDFGANDWNKWRLIMSLSALALFLLNLFTGYIRVGGGKYVSRQLGIK